MWLSIGVSTELLSMFTIDDVWLYDSLLVPYWNHAVADSPSAFTIPVKVAKSVVTFVAEPVITTGGLLPAAYVIVIVVIPVLPTLSVAFIVISLSPSIKATFEILQLIVLLSVSSLPLPVLHTTLFISLVMSEALPLMVIVLLVVL